MSIPSLHAHTLTHSPPPPVPKPHLLPPSHPENSPPIDLPHYSQKDKAWVRQANAAAAGALLASKRRLRQHLRSLPPDSSEAQAIRSFLLFGT